MGPIGVDNSELINIEMEEEYKEKNQHLLNLVSGGNKGEMSYSEADKENQSVNETNAKLLARLTAMANSESKSMITSGGKSTYSCSHEEWVRRKEHEKKLKIKLIEEAKKDLREQMIKKLQEEEERNEEKKKALSDWDIRKKQEDFIKKRDTQENHEKERIQKQIKQETSYRVFKEWLKKSLIKQREDMIEQRMMEQD